MINKNDVIYVHVKSDLHKIGVTMVLIFSLKLLNRRLFDVSFWYLWDSMGLKDVPFDAYY